LLEKQQKLQFTGDLWNLVVDPEVVARVQCRFWCFLCLRASSQSSTPFTATKRVAQGNFPIFPLFLWFSVGRAGGGSTSSILLAIFTISHLLFRTNTKEAIPRTNRAAAEAKATHRRIQRGEVDLVVALVAPEASKQPPKSSLAN
jgi:hypothetical protein